MMDEIAFGETDVEWKNGYASFIVYAVSLERLEEKIAEEFNASEAEEIVSVSQGVFVDSRNRLTYTGLVIIK